MIQTIKGEYEGHDRTHQWIQSEMFLALCAHVVASFAFFDGQTRFLLIAQLGFKWERLEQLAEQIAQILPQKARFK